MISIDRRLQKYTSKSQNIGQLPSPQPKQKEFIDNVADILCFGGAAGSGKAQPCYTISEYLKKGHSYKEVCYNIKKGIFKINQMEQHILDWRGNWKPMSLIEVGDRIMNPDGQFQEVLEVFDRGFLQTYKITFEDGTQVECCGEHLWSFWEARANSRRKSKEAGCKEVYSNLSPEGWNKNYITRVRIKNTLWLKDAIEKERKLLIPVNAPLNFTQLNRADSEKAYVYGVMIGDGCFPRKEFCGHIDDKFIYDEVNRIAEGKLIEYIGATRPNLRVGQVKQVEWLMRWIYSQGFHELRSENKRLPKNFQIMPLKYRYSLAQGLFDTDGYVSATKREVSFTTVSKQLADEVCTLVRTLGYLAKIHIKNKSGYKDKEGNFVQCKVAYTVNVEGNDLELLFRLPRKVERAKALGKFNNGKSWVGKAIISIVETENKEFCRCIKVSNPNSCYITNGYNITHNTASLLIDFAQNKFVENPQYRACILRRTYPEINSPGGLADESRNLYIPIGGTLTKNPFEWKFPTGAKIAFRHLQHDKDIYSFQGSQITRIGFDELVHFTEEQFFYLLSRNRSTCGIRPQVRATCNPDADSWVAKLINWWIDEKTGLPIKERSGVVRYFVRFQRDLIWGDSEEELKAEYPNLDPKSFSFIPATIYDNQVLLRENPSYLSNLMALHPVEKARLLEGNWKIKFEAGTIFDRSWFPVGDRPVEEGTAVRFWDLAATAKEVAKSTSFYTCGVKLLKVGDIYYVIDIIYAQKKPGDVEQLIRSVALQDGKKVRVRWELEGGSAGKLFADMLLQKLQGFNAKAIKPIGDKVTRSYNTATAATQGKIFIVRANWNDQFLNAVQCFDGSPQPLINDIVDAFNGAYHELSQDRKALYDKLYS